MRKTLTILSVGLLALSATLFYAEHKQALGRVESVGEAIEGVLRAQNQSLAGRIFDGIQRADRDALATLHRWRKKARARSFLSDTALAEPDAPKWSIVAGRRVRAAGVLDDALLEDALDAHLTASEPLALYAAKGKYYLFIKGMAEGQPYASAYVPEAFFAAFRSADGIRAWMVLRDGSIVYHPLSRFIGSNGANLRPVAAGIQELAAGGSAPYSQRYLGLEGRDALGAWTPLPSYGLLVGSEWPKAPEPSFSATALYWLAILTGGAGLLLLGGIFGSSRPQPVAQPRLFDEGRLDDEALEYLEQARHSASEALDFAQNQERLASEARREKNEVLSETGELQWRLDLLEEYQSRVLPLAGGKDIWKELARLVALRAPGLSISVYRYSPTSFSLVPEGIFTLLDLPDHALTHLRDSRIFLGNPQLMGNLLATEGFRKWDQQRQKQMPRFEADFRAYPVEGGQFGKGLLLVFFDRRFNQGGELAAALNLFETLYSRTVTFCERLGRLIQSSYAQGSAWKAVASSADDARNRPRPT